MMWMMQIYATLLATTIGTLSIRRRLLVLQLGLLHDRLWIEWMIRPRQQQAMLWIRQHVPSIRRWIW